MAKTYMASTWWAPPWPNDSSPPPTHLRKPTTTDAQQEKNPPISHFCPSCGSSARGVPSPSSPSTLPAMAVHLHRSHPLLFSLFLFPLLFIAACSAAAAADSVLHLPSDDGGPLCAGSPPASCPVNCFRPDPVCGDDGVTYWCGCADAACSGARAAKRGFCQIGNGGSAPVPGQALLLIHIVWLVVLGVAVLFGFF